MKRPQSFAAEVIEELREYAYKLDWSGSALDTVVGIVRKVQWCRSWRFCYFWRGKEKAR